MESVIVHLLGFFPLTIAKSGNKAKIEFQDLICVKMLFAVLKQMCSFCGFCSFLL